MHNEEIRRLKELSGIAEAPLEEANPAYYKQPIMSLEQLKKSCVRLSTDTRMGSSTKAQHIERMFSEYEESSSSQPTSEAVGEFAEPLYTLQDELGLEDNILVDELARWMDGQDITDFVKRFRQNHEMPEGGVEEGKKTDHDGDGDVDSDDYMAAKDKAIKKSMNKKEDK